MRFDISIRFTNIFYYHVISMFIRYDFGNNVTFL